MAVWLTAHRRRHKTGREVDVKQYGCTPLCKASVPVNPTAQLVSVVVLILAGLAVWWRWWNSAGLPRISTILPVEQGLPAAAKHAATSRLPYHPLALLIVVFAVLQIQQRFAFTPETEVVLPELKTLWEGILIAVLQLVAFALVIGSTGEFRYRDWGITPERLPSQLRLGVGTFAASYVPVLAVLLATAFLRTADNQHTQLKLLAQDSRWQIVATVAVQVVLIAPLVEELCYRVILQSTVTRFANAYVGIGFTAVLFSAVHGWPDALPLLPLALVLGVVYHVSRSYVAIVTAHACFNAWNLWQALAFPPPG